MTLRELELAVSIRPNHTSTEMKNRPLPARLRSVCVPIVEVVGEDTMAFVHFSAKEYLLSNHSGPFIDRAAAQLNIAIASSTYFGFRCFDEGITQDEVVRLVFHGDVRLLEYIQSSWIRHVYEAYSSSDDMPQLALLSALLRMNIINKHFTKAARAHDHQTFEDASEKPVSLPVQNPRRMPPDISSALIRILGYRAKLRQTLRSQEVLEKWCGENDPLDIQKASRKLLSTMEGILEGKVEVFGEPDAAEKLRKLYGQKLFKCHHQICAMFSTEGFETAAKRKQHEDKHCLPYKCLAAENCFYKEIGFSSKQQLQRHTRDCHNNSFVAHSRVARNLEVLVRTIHRPRPTSELEIRGRHPASNALRSKSVTEETPSEQQQPPNTGSMAHDSPWGYIQPTPVLVTTLEHNNGTNNPFLKHKESQQTPPPPERHAQQNSRDERTNHNLTPTATESSIYTNSIFSPSADWDFDLDMGMAVGPADDSTQKHLDIPTDRRRESALDTNAIFSPSADWDFDHDMGMAVGPADDSTQKNLDIPTDRRRESALDTNAIFSPSVGWVFDHDFGMTVRPADLDDLTPKNLDISTDRRRALDTNTIFSPSADWDDLGLAAGPAGNLTPVPVATFEHSNGTNNPFIKLEQAQAAYLQPWGWTSNRLASGSSTPTVYGRYNNPFIKLEQAQPAYGPGQ
ncbi:hypothetical protein K440DRAFT_683183 [Wilcoxina mikolae CBS 423.85]|nr:hypothetical protein K440DRAFT_683183 [Wilcoxina mikolae CBS 423.85]